MAGLQQESGPETVPVIVRPLTEPFPARLPLQTEFTPLSQRNDTVPPASVPVTEPVSVNMNEISLPDCWMKTGKDAVAVPQGLDRSW